MLYKEQLSDSLCVLLYKDSMHVTSKYFHLDKYIGEVLVLKFRNRCKMCVLM